RARAGLEFGPALAGFGEHAAICEDMAKLGPLAHLLTSPPHDLLDGFDGADSPGIVTAPAAISEPAVPEPFTLDIGAAGAGFGL
ncbi:hypothetical protein, partial [Nocardia cyriacigeorgica]|uniref:hypothetical protein n=1 Tax=Nocardia cyriacigeorgica TaxID=135487 RepID=UPI0018956E75